MDDLFSECVDALKELRRTVHSDADPSVSLALDEVIAKLEGYKNEANIDEAKVKRAALEGLMIISAILSCCASVADLMRRF